MNTLRPESPEMLAQCLCEAAAGKQTIRLGGNFSKDRLGGPPQPADVTISTLALNRLLQYDPRDLTISVQAGMPFAELERILAEHRQMLPLDPGWGAESTVGGVVAANISGPRRRLYGTARDMIIGMTFATLEGKLVNSGGMVVKNVAGLDMAKLMIGSFGTLAGIAVVNFKVFPVPAESRTFVMEFATAAEAFAERDRILRGALQPMALDLVNWPSGYFGYCCAPEETRRCSIVTRANLPEATALPDEISLGRDSRVHSPFPCTESGRQCGVDLLEADRDADSASEAQRAVHRAGRLRRDLRALRHAGSSDRSGRRLCDDDKGERNVRSRASAEPGAPVWPYLSRRPARGGSLHCVHCGLCLNACPTYRELHVEMDSPRGRIYQMVQVSNGAPITESYQEHIDLCLACRGCETACPSGVEYGRLMEAARADIEQRVRRPLATRLLRWLVFERLLPSRHAAALAGRGDVCLSDLRTCRSWCAPPAC